MMIKKLISYIKAKARNLYHMWIRPFPGSQQYWINRYDYGSNSGRGSYGKLAEFKAELINDFVKEKGITSIIEYGCGDGNQLKLANYPSYIGFDISPKAIDLCRDIFRNDSTKKFILMDRYNNETAELTLSLDVIYHLIEDEIFNQYMNRLFDSSHRYVIIYSSDTDDNQKLHGHHIKHRNFSSWVSENKLEWTLLSHIPNKYPLGGDHKQSSFSDFYIYQKA